MVREGMGGLLRLHIHVYFPSNLKVTQTLHVTEQIAAILYLIVDKWEGLLILAQW